MTQGPSSAADLAAALRVDRSTITRAIGNLGHEVASLGATRSTRYALRRKIREAAAWPIYRVDRDGHAALRGTLESFHGAWRVAWESEAPAWAGHFSDREGLWEGFPFFLADLRPQGFLGSLIIRQIARSHQLPEDSRAWIDDDTLIFLASFGEDVPGDLVIGDECLRSALAARLAPSEVHERYAGLAELVASSPPPGSSAGGEHPKFLAVVSDDREERRAVLVKFSSPLSQELGRRWADLLAMEFHALETLAGAGLADHGHRLIDSGNRRFLEAPRFDRTPGGGRSGAVSLEALHGAACGGIPPDWTGRVLDLESAGLVDQETVRQTRRLQAFGELIGNTDMHAGNLAFRMSDELPFTLAPAYDMLPMLWAPGPQGELGERNFSPRPPLPAAAAEWREMLGLAREFWQRVARDERISRNFRATAKSAGGVLTHLAASFG